MSIVIQEINKSYNHNEALKNVSFSIGKGEVVGFLGPNGAGKSTLMKIITCYIQQDSGKIEICGKETREEEIHVKSMVGYLPENNPLYPDMYIKEYLLFIGNIYKVKDLNNRISDIIKKTGLESEIGKKIHQLSKGFRQRIGLAAALIHDPEVLILDEPTTGLDPNQLLEIRRLIKDIGANKTVLLSTHIMQEVDKICNRIIIISNGQIIDDQPIHFFTRNQISLEDHFIKLTT